MAYRSCQTFVLVESCATRDLTLGIRNVAQTLGTLLGQRPEFLPLSVEVSSPGPGADGRGRDSEHVPCLFGEPIVAVAGCA
jgi:hypothetical protein